MKRAGPGILALLLCAAALPSSASSNRDWRFEVFLDDKPIGYHHFRLSDAGDGRKLSSAARFSVKVLGLTVYRYVHQSHELWDRDCLQRIEASTDDNGRDFLVRGTAGNRQLVLHGPDGDTGLAGCVMTFAYWNPAILSQQRLLNAQTGEYLEIDVQRLGPETLQLTEGPLPATRYRISTGERDIELWYSADNDWVALSSTTRGGRQLHYRRIGPFAATGSSSDD